MKIDPPKLDDIMAHWEKDSQIDFTEPGKELIRVPLLHSKYGRYLVLHNLAIKRQETKYNKMKKLKWLYYNGKLDQAELVKLGWEPFPFTLKSDLNVYLDGDNDLCSLNEAKTYHVECARYCENVIKELNNRTWQLREYIKWELFINGQH